jgi:hypothetical protein
MDDALSMLREYSQVRPSARRCLATLNAMTHLQPVSKPEIAAFNSHKSHEAVVNGSMSRHREDLGEHSALPSMDLDWTLSAGADDAMFDFLSDQWFTQPQLDSFNFVGI